MKSAPIWRRGRRSDKWRLLRATRSITDETFSCHKGPQGVRPGLSPPGSMSTSRGAAISGLVYRDHGPRDDQSDVCPSGCLCQPGPAQNAQTLITRR